jgi:16S rRNA G966 N2-methylase RsmD
MSARLGAQNAEAVFGIVVGDALNEAASTFCDDFSGSGFMAASAATRGACMLFAQTGASAATSVV